MRKKKVPSVRQSIPRLSPKPDQGLTAAQAAERVRLGWHNRSTAALTKSTGQIFRDNFCTFFNLLFALLAACLFAVGAYRDMLFLGIVLINAAIGVVQELRVRHTLNRIQLLSAQRCTVIRDGVSQSLLPEELVLDDIIQLQAGCQVCADAIVCDGTAEVNESLLTGEADPVAKRPGDCLLSGSFLVSGRCRARLDRVGEDAYANRITGEATRQKAARSEMMRALDRLLRLIGVVIVPVGAVMLARQAALLPFPYAVRSTVAAVVGMIPEGLYLLVSAALTVSVLRLARRNTLTHELSCIEHLARVDVLCLDKTGTITEGSMEVEALFPLSGVEQGELAALLGRFCVTTSSANATAQALRAKFGADAAPWTGAAEIPFSSERKWSALAPDAGGPCYLLGAPERLLGGALEELRSCWAEAVAQGNRVLLLAQAPELPQENELDTVRPLGFVVLSDQLRRDAGETLAFFQAQGVTVKILSGDNAEAVSRIARRAGIPRSEHYVDASQLPETGDLSQEAEENTVFGRVTPRQKRALIQGLQQAGHTVAMIGDGVNDVLALKQADCSIAMAAGSEAAQHAAQLVLLDSSFSSMPQILKEGRRVINNIQRSATLFLVKNIFSCLMTLLLLFLPLPYPLVPAQISLVSALMIGAPSFLLTFEPSFTPVSRRFLPSVLLNALPGGLVNLISLSAAAVLGTAAGLSIDQLSTVCTLLMGLNGLLVLLFLCWPLTPFRTAVLLLMGLSFAGAVLFLAPLFQITALTAQSWRLLGLLAALSPALMILLTFLISRVKRLLQQPGLERSCSYA
ncbi:MAG: HAD-IC family P-type ATPase [Oscillospiraceae bacterium]|nr:HAD-IC family P-type ATPase [Oscillospiraceae bacterium]